MDFVAIDVETANPDLASICQIGLVRFDNGAAVSTWQSMVDPEDYFDPVNQSIHGISERDVRGAPTLPQLYPDLRQMTEDSVVACHTHFDRLAIARAAARYRLPDLECPWLDTAKVARRTWAQCARNGYGLADLCEMLQIDFMHHVAQEDARASGEILVQAIAQTGLSVEEWLIRTREPIGGLAPIARQGNPEGILAGEILVFTGTMSMPRRAAADLAAQVGCEVLDSVNKHTTILVVGDQDLRKLAGHEKSAKHRKAEQLITKGQSIRILRESDFRALCILGD